MEPQETKSLLQLEWDAIVAAPLTFGAAVIVIAFGIWLVMRWHFSGAVSSKDATIQAKESQLELAEKQRDLALSDLKKLEEVSASSEEGTRALAKMAKEWPTDLQKTFSRLTSGEKLVVKVRPETPDEENASANATYLLSVGFADVAGRDDQTITMVSSSSAASVAGLITPGPKKEDA